ncbi:MAG: SDR family oxidoreductase [Rhodocyclaceae bacterium]|nr:SDR family oxidoreductase [Rhodocyclaceae bacterium]
MRKDRFEGRVAIVTGGTTGIGAATARRLVEEGARVVVAARRPEPGLALVAELGEDRVRFCKCDVTVQSDVEALIAMTVETFGGLDILVNNAGVTCFGGYTPDLSSQDWHQTIAINLHSIYYACKAAIPHMKCRGGGAIVNTTSISGMSADYGFTAYNAAKGGAINYTKALAIDHAQDNIRVNTVAPGLVDTPMADALEQFHVREPWVANIPMKRGGKPEEIANIIAFLASDEASFMTGSVVVADGGLSATTGQPNLPKLLAELGVAG